MQILVIDDDGKAARDIAKALAASGHAVSVESDGRSALLRAVADRFDLIILDRKLPEIDGLAIVQTLRAMRNETPIFIVSAMAGIDDRVMGLKAGADDYLAKPFAMSELAARADALLRRAPTIAVQTRLAIDDLEIDILGQQVRRQGRTIELTAQQFRVLVYLAQNAGRIVTRSMLLEHAWDYDFDPQTNIVDQHLSRLRRKVDEGFGRSLIETVRGSGYVMRVRGED